MRFLRGITNMENIILFDWVTFTTKDLSFENLLELVGLDSQNLPWELLNGHNLYKSRYHYGGISINFDGRRKTDKNGMPVEMGTCFEMSGQGCRLFEEISNISIPELFKRCKAADCHFTRIDIAYDDFNYCIPINNIIHDIHKFNWVSRVSEFRVEEHAGHAGQTVYIGSRSSALFLRIYDKKFERSADDIPYWFRLEMQIKQHKADDFIDKYLSGKWTIGELFFGVLDNFVRFVEPTENDSNKRRWNKRQYWIKLLGDIERIKLATPKTTEYNLKRCKNFVYNTAANSVECLINYMGVVPFLKEMIKNKHDYTQKYLSISDNVGEILRFIEDYEKKT